MPRDQGTDVLWIFGGGMGLARIELAAEGSAGLGLAGVFLTWVGLRAVHGASSSPVLPMRCRASWCGLVWAPRSRMSVRTDKLGWFGSYPQEEFFRGDFARRRGSGAAAWRAG